MLLGIDSGQTAMKVVIFDHDGREHGSCTVHSPVNSPAPHMAERDMAQLAVSCDQSIKTALANATVAGSEIDAVGIVGHGDGLYLVDANHAPVRPAIVAVDTRATSLLRQWRDNGIAASAVAATGQQPFPASLAPLVAWLQRNEPESLHRTKWILSCKDWLRLSLTGAIGTDRSEASSSVGSIDGRGYSADALKAYAIEEISHKLPQIFEASAVVGEISAEAAYRTGLAAGTPVVTGTHDVIGMALGSGATQPGHLSVAAGTWSVNQLISTTRVVDPKFQARPWLDGQSWILMASSPSSATNLDWFIRTLMSEVEDPLEVIDAEVRSVQDDPSSILFMPYLYGSPLDQPSSGTLIGVHAWHRRAHLLRAIMEGVVLNHRLHLSSFTGLVKSTDVFLSGGAARSEPWTQMFADALSCQIRVAEPGEPGCLGAAMLAGIGVGIFSGLVDAQRRCVRSIRVHKPDPQLIDRWDLKYQHFMNAIDSLSPLWAALDEQTLPLSSNNSGEGCS